MAGNVHHKVHDIAKARENREQGKTGKTRDLLEGDDDSEYSWEHFYTRSVDQLGHSTEIRVRVDTHIAGGVASVVAGNKFPQYRTNADVLRDALYHRMMWLKTVEGDVEGKELLEIELRRERTRQLQAKMDKNECYVKELEESVQQAERLRDVSAMRMLIQQMHEEMPKLKSPYKDTVAELCARCEGRLSLK